MTEVETSGGLGDIAVVGMAGRFPKAANVDEFWANLRDGVECISFFSDEELEASGIPPEVYNDPMYVPAWGWMDGVDMFDPGFFDITPREAEITDPQIRILLETAWEALENSGYDPDRFPGRIGVYAGSSMMFYLWQNLVPTPKLIESVGATQAWIVNDRDFVATRVNYKLNLKGPGMTVQTACSTSLVAIHLGIQSLLSGESDMVLAGGVSAPTPYKEGYMYVEGGTMAPDGHVRTFDAKAKGMLGGNGSALVVLKRLEDALADGDNIRAVIKGTALNNDGVDKVTYTAPSVDGQSQVILDALDVADVSPTSISYVEAHGTGTPLGDPIEIAALTQAWRTKLADGAEALERGWCPIGAVKSNIGHLDTAAGVAGVVKTVLSLEHKEIPPSLHFEQANPEIDFESSPFFVNTELRTWDTTRLPRRATVSSLGMGGTNAHAILEEAPELAPTSAGRSHELLLVSGRSDATLEESCANLAQHLAEHPEGQRANLADVAYTTQVGRKAFRHRRIMVAKDKDDAIDALRTKDRARTATGGTMQSRRAVAFLFSGQGSQYANMTRGLYESESVFRAEVDRACELLTPSVGLDLRTLFFPEAGGEEAAAKELEKTQFTQPALFVIEYALAKQLEAWGVEADAMLGHSIGEYVAACLAGVFSLEDALALVAARGRLIGSLPEGGAMMAIQLPESAVKGLVGSTLFVATINAPELCVVSGPVAALDALEKDLEAKNVSTRRLHTSHAFHSGLMDPILDEFEAVVRKTTLHAPERRVVSCTTGTWLTDAEAQDPAYWVRHIRKAVRFADGVETLLEDDRILLEVGPGQSLTSLAQMTTMVEKPNAVVIATTRHPRDESDDVAVLLRALGELWMAGAEIDWAGFRAEETRRRVILPSYPFERRRLWIERPDPSTAAGTAAGPAPERKQPDMADWFYAPSWKLAPPAIALDADERAKRWLIFSDGGSLAKEIRGRAQSEGREVFTVEVGDAFARDGSAFTIDRSNPDDYRTLIDTLANDGGAPGEIVYLWTLAEHTDDSLEPEFFALLFLAQALSGREAEGGIRVDVVTADLHDVLGTRPARAQTATVLGPCMSMNLELAGVTARSLDLERAAGSEDALWSELVSATEQPVLALHASRRWALTYESTHLPERSERARLREGAVVLVTGGLGGIGLSLGAELAGAKAKLVLVSRSGLPDRDAWDAWREEHGDDDRVSNAIDSVRELERLGAEVMVCAADSTDTDAMRVVVERAEAKFGAVNGVIHAAGIAGAGILELKTREGAEAVLAAKVQGTLALQSIFAKHELDFVLLCSSISSICVGFGQVDYFAANAFLDSIASTWNGANGTHVVAVNWDAWQEVGMAVNTEIPDEMKAGRAATLRLGIAPDEGRRAFRRILATELAQVVVSPRALLAREDFVARFDLRPSTDAEPGLEDAVEAEAAEASRSTVPRPELSTAFVAAEGDAQEKIAAIWADLLGLEKVGVNDNFFELGGNSLVMMQVNVRMRAIFGVSLPIRELFEIPEVALVAERMDSIRAVSEARASDASSEDVEEFTI